MHPRVVALLQRPQWAQRTPEWYDIRRTLLTASDVAGALDIKPFASYKGSPREDLLTKKLQNKPFGNIFTAHGQKYEDEARDMMASFLGEEVVDFGLLVHPTLPWLGASPDGVTKTGKCVEIKCPMRRQIIPGVVPHHYEPQIQVQMEVCDLDTTLFVQYRPAAMNPDKKPILDITVVERDRQWFQDNLGSMQQFFDEYKAALETYVPGPPSPPPPCLIEDALYEDYDSDDSDDP